MLIATKDSGCGIRKPGLNPSWDYKVIWVSEPLHLSLTGFLCSIITAIPISHTAFGRVEQDSGVRCLAERLISTRALWLLPKVYPSFLLPTTGSVQGPRP